MSLLFVWPLATIAAVRAAPAPQPSVLVDDGDRQSLLTALARTKTYLQSLTKPSLPVAGRDVTPDQLRRSLLLFEALVANHWGTPDLETALRERFDWIAMPGERDSGVVHLTGYFQPLLDAREAPDAVYRFPLYGPPTDMLSIDFGAFKPALAGQKGTGRVNGNMVVPYFTRQEIDQGEALARKGWEVAWLADDRARQSLMIQGSGSLRFADGRVVNANYAAQNGHPFKVGEGNPSYVFFKLAPDGPFGCDGIPLTGGRAIATDKRHFASGTIAWLSYSRPKFDAMGKVVGSEPGGRFVFDQDTGGAITGPGRADVFWGQGEDAGRRAHALNGEGRIFFLLAKPDQGGRLIEKKD